MAKQKPLKKVWVTKKLIARLARDEVPWKAKTIEEVLNRVADETNLVRTRTKHGKRQFRAKDIAKYGFDPCVMEQLEQMLGKKKAPVFASVGWALTQLFDPEAVAQARQEVMEAFTVVEADDSAPRDRIWFSSKVAEKVLSRLSFGVKPHQKTETFLENKLALLTAIAGCDEDGAPSAITDLRAAKAVDDVWLNVQDLVDLGQDEVALTWLRTRLTPNFGPQSILLMQDVAKTLQAIYPVGPQSAKPKQ